MIRNQSLLIGAIALLLAFPILLGCSAGKSNVAIAYTESHSVKPGGIGENKSTVAKGRNSALTETHARKSVTPKADGQAQVVASNEAFRIYGPEPDSIVGTRFTVRGQARVLEASFSYSFEDGHNVLAEGQVNGQVDGQVDGQVSRLTQAGKGSPDWRDFAFTVTLTDMPTSPTGVLTIYDTSANGSAIHKLHLAYQFQEGLLKLEAE